MKVWIGKNKHNTTLIFHNHYTKEVSSRMVMHENSFQGARGSYFFRGRARRAFFSRAREARIFFEGARGAYFFRGRARRAFFSRAREAHIFSRAREAHIFNLRKNTLSKLKLTRFLKHNFTPS